MKIRVQVIVELDDGAGEIVQDIAQLERGQLRLEGLGLTLAEAKGLLEGLQRAMVEQQIIEYSKQQSSCALCGKQRLHKGAHAIVYRTLFGKLELSSPRLFHCQCQPQPTRSFRCAGGVTRRKNGAGTALSRSEECISRFLWAEYEAL